MKPRRFSLIVCGAVLLHGSLLLALILGFSRPSAASSAPCADDVRKLCSAEVKGRLALRACLERHADQLSSACREQLALGRELVEQRREACRGDVERLCSGIRPGGGRLAACLREHASELSPACRNFGPRRG